MKKLFTLAALAVLGLSAQAQSLGSLLGGLTNNETVGNIIGAVTNTIYSAPVSLRGTYYYGGSAVNMSSSEGGILTELAGTAITSGAEKKVDAILAKFGIKEGVTTFTFNEDDTFTCTVMGVPLSGNYKVGEGEKTVTLTFGRVLKYLSMTGTLKSTTGGFEILFPANKMLTFLKKVASVAGKKSSEISTINSLASGYDNFKLGFKLLKAQ